MPLEKRQIEILLNGGLNTQEHQEAQGPANLTECNGFRFGQLGRLERLGAVKDYVNITQPTGGQWDAPALKSMMKLGTEPVAITDHYGLVSVASDNGTLRQKWKWRDAAIVTGVALPLQPSPVPLEVSRDLVASSHLGAREPAVAVYQSYMVIVWAEGATRIAARAYDLTTGHVVATTEYSSLSGYACVRACTLNESTRTGVLFTWSAGGSPSTIYSARFDSGSRTFVNIGSLGTCQYGEHALAASTTSSRFYLAYQDNTTGLLRVDDRSTTAITSTHNGTHDCQYGVELLDVGGGCVIVSNTYVAAWLVYAEFFGTPGTTLTLWTGTAARGLHMGRVRVAPQTFSYSGSTYGAEVFITQSDSTTLGAGYVNKLVVCQSFTYDSGTLALFGVSRDVPNVYAVGAFSHDGRAYGIFRNGTDSSTADPSYVVHRVDCTTTTKRVAPVARIAHDRALTTTYSGGTIALSVAVVVSGDDVRIVSAGDGGDKGESVFLNTLTFNAADVPWFEHGGCLYFSAGLLYCYDGAHVFEATPLRAPVVYGTGSGTEAKAVYEFIDARGNLHRSAPSASDAFTAGNNVYVEKPGAFAFNGTDNQEMRCTLYVNDGASGTEYFYAGRSTTTTADGQFWEFSTVSASAGLTANIYTDGGELAADAPPAFHHLCVVGDRAWGVDAEDRTRVWFTKPFVAGYAPEWSSFCTLNIGDNAVAIADVGGVPTILGERGIWQIYGEGPSATGVGTFAPARRLPHEVGCVSRGSVVKTPAGVFFASEAGFALLGNGLDLQPVGLPIADLTRSETTTRAIYDRTHNEVRALNGGLTYVYSLDNGKWTRRDHGTSDSSQQAETDIVFCDGRVWAAHNDAYMISEYTRDDTSSYAQLSSQGVTLETPWIKFDGIAGFGRLWKVMIPTFVPQDFYSSELAISVYLDFDGSTERFRYDFSTEMADWETDAVETIVLRMQTQKMQALKIRWVQTPSGGGIRSALVPLSLRLEYGVTQNSRPTYNTTGPGLPPS